MTRFIPNSVKDFDKVPIFVLMNALYQDVTHKKNASFSVERFDRNKACTHEGLHFHHSYEIVFIKNGKGSIVVNNTCLEYKNGALIFLGPYLPHFGFSNNEHEDNFEIVIHFDELFVENRLKQIQEFHSLVPVINKSQNVIIYSPEFKEEQANLFEDLVDLSSLEQLASIFNLLCRFALNSDYQYLLDAPLQNNSKNNKQIEHIFKFINDNYVDAISTKHIANHLNLTTNSFCKLFRKLTNKTFITYLNEYRIHRAVNLIENTESNISEIAFKCGFENLSYFSKVFFKVKGISPNNYKKTHRITIN